MKRLSILLVTPTLGGGGAERQIARLARHLSSEQFHITVAQFRGGGSYQEAIPSGVGLTTLCPRWMKSSTICTLFSIWRLTKLIRRTGPDIIHANQNHTNAACATALYLTGTAAKLVLGVQNNVSQDRASSRLRPRFVFDKWHEKTYAMADKIICISDGVRSNLESKMPSVQNKTQTIYNAGFDESVLKGMQMPLSVLRPSGPLVIALGRLSPQKDHEMLLQAFALARREVKGLTLWIVGGGALQRRLEERCEELGMENNVQFLGYQPNPFPFLAAADVLALSSRFEGFANVLVEAMACGITVVSTDCKYGPGEIIRDMESGILVPVGDVKAMASALVNILNDPALRRRLSAGGIERASAFSAEKSISSYAKAFVE